MVAPGFLKNPGVIDWLGGVEPAWTLLTFESMNALRQEPSNENRALTLANNLTGVENPAVRFGPQCAHSAHVTAASPKAAVRSAARIVAPRRHRGG